MTPGNTLSSHLATALLACVALWIGFLIYGSTGHDDSHITFWAAHSLLEYGEILNYNGDRVEQSSSLLLTLLTALASGISTLPVVVCGYLIPVLASLLTCLLLANIRTCPPAATAPRDSDSDSDSVGGVWPVLLVCSAASFLLWSFSGMESTLAALCLLWMLVCWSRWLNHHTAWPAVILSTALLLMVRPEMPLVALALALSLLPAYRQRAGRLLLLTLALAALLWLLRQQYFGSGFPQPVSAKQGSDLQLQTGAYYLLFNGVLNPVTLLGALVALPLCSRHYWLAVRRQLPATALPTPASLPLLCANTLLIYLAFIWLSGGDWMQAGRFLVPLVPLAVVLVLYVAGLCRWRRLMQLLQLLLCAGQAWLHVPALATLSHGTPLWVQYRLDHRFAHYSVFEQWNQEHVRDMAVIDHLQSLVTDLNRQRAEPVTVLSGQSGMVFYYTAQQFFRHVRFYDLRGLVDKQLTDCALTHHIARSRQGLFWGYPEFFALLPQMETQCGIRKPDIIYDLNDMSQKLGQTLEQFGYVMIHQEQGFVLENSTRLPWNRLLSPNMIFIRQDLLPLLHDPEKRIVRYPDLPLRTRNLTWTPY